MGEKKKTVFFIALVASVAIGVIYVILVGQKTPPPPAVVVASPKVNAESRSRPAKKVSRVPLGRNPFTQKSFSDDSKSLPLLKGIVWDTQRPGALIDDSIVYPGDRIDEYTVILVNPNSVILSGETGETILRLGD